MRQERFSNLDLLSIEKELCEDLNLSEIIDKLAEIKARKIK